MPATPGKHKKRAPRRRLFFVGPPGTILTSYYGLRVRVDEYEVDEIGEGQTGTAGTTVNPGDANLEVAVGGSSAVADNTGGAVDAQDTGGTDEFEGAVSGDVDVSGVVGIPEANGVSTGVAGVVSDAGRAVGGSAETEDLGEESFAAGNVVQGVATGNAHVVEVVRGRVNNLEQTGGAGVHQTVGREREVGGGVVDGSSQGRVVGECQLSSQLLAGSGLGIEVHNQVDRGGAEVYRVIGYGSSAAEGHGLSGSRNHGQVRREGLERNSVGIESRYNNEHSVRRYTGHSDGVGESSGVGENQVGGGHGGARIEVKSQSGSLRTDGGLRSDELERESSSIVVVGSGCHEIVATATTTNSK